MNHRKILETIESKFCSLSSIKGLFYTGSTATERYDQFSDLDIYLLTDCDANIMLDDIIDFINKEWLVVMVNRTSSSMSVYIKPDFFKIELSIIEKEDLRTGFRLKNARIVKDFDNALADLKKKSQDLDVSVSYEEALQLFIDFRESQLYVARHTARGWKWSAMGDANYQGEQLFYLLSRLKGRLQYGFREAEHFLTSEELKLLTATRCHTTDTEEIYRAMKAIWILMKYTENYYNQQQSKQLEINTPDGEILEYIHKLYSEAVKIKLID